MSDILNVISTHEFWFGAVFVGLVVNVVGYFVSSYLKSLFSRFYGAWDNRNRKSREFREHLVDYYSSSYQLLCLGKIEQGHQKLDIIFYVSIAIMMLAFGNIGSFGAIASAVALIPALAAFSAIIRHGRFMLLMSDAEARLVERDKGP